MPIRGWVSKQPRVQEAPQLQPRTKVKIVEWQGDEDFTYVHCNDQGLLPKEAVTAVFGEDVTALRFEVAGGGGESVLLEHGNFHPPGDGDGFATKTFVIVRAKSRTKTYPTIKVE